MCHVGNNGVIVSVRSRYHQGLSGLKLVPLPGLGSHGTCHVRDTCCISCPWLQVDNCADSLVTVDQRMRCCFHDCMAGMGGTELHCETNVRNAVSRCTRIALLHKTWVPQKLCAKTYGTKLHLKTPCLVPNSPCWAARRMHACMHV